MLAHTDRKLACASLLAGYASGAIINMESALDSKINFGNAVVSAHCKSDELMSLVGITTNDDRVLSAMASDALPPTVKVHLMGVRTDCTGLLGTKPCGTATTDYAFPRFYCDWASSIGPSVTTGPVQGLVQTDGTASSTYLLCPSPSAEAQHHTLTLSVRHVSATTTTEFPFTGEPGMNSISATTNTPTASPTLQPTTAGPYNSCYDAFTRGASTGLTEILGVGGSGSGFREIWCDQTNHGGGWALVANIRHDSTDHSNEGFVGHDDSASLVITPSTSRVAKYSDAMIAELQGHAPASTNEVQFNCEGFATAFFHGCTFDATEGLDESEAGERACVVSYHQNDNQDQELNGIKCNVGSQGVGSHCSQDVAAAYCSHCPGNKQGSAYSGNCNPGGGKRCGCWTDEHHYHTERNKLNGAITGTGFGGDGDLWVR
jgi:hypothetical protein